MNKISLILELRISEPDRKKYEILGKTSQQHSKIEQSSPNKLIEYNKNFDKFKSVKNPKQSDDNSFIYSSNNVDLQNITDTPGFFDKKNVKCAWCSLNIQDKPFPIPFKYFNDKFYIYSNIYFCTPNCALSYNLSGKMMNKWEISGFIHHFYSLISGKKIDKIFPSPPKEIMIDYGGHLSSSEYQDIINQNKITFIINLPPIVNNDCEFQMTNQGFDSFIKK